MRRSLVAAAAAAGTLLVAAAPALGHAGFVSASPAPGATVTQLRRVQLRFSEPLNRALSHARLRERGLDAALDRHGGRLVRRVRIVSPGQFVTDRVVAVGRAVPIRAPHP
jgi:methionine-rich copper-binding protein CopC